MTLPGVEAIRPTAKWPPRSALPAPTPAECVDALVNRGIRRQPPAESLRQHPPRATDTRSVPPPSWAVILFERASNRAIAAATPTFPTHLSVTCCSRLPVRIVPLFYAPRRRIIHVEDAEIVGVGGINPIGVAGIQCLARHVAQRHALGKRDLRVKVGSVSVSVLVHRGISFQRVDATFFACSNLEIRR